MQSGRRAAEAGVPAEIAAKRPAANQRTPMELKTIAVTSAEDRP